MRLDNPAQVRDFRKDARGQSERVRSALARKLGVGASYYHGHHFQSRDGYVQRDWQSWQTTLRSAGVSRNDMRVAMNRVTKHIVKIAAASFMRNYDAEVVPEARARGQRAALLAQVNEDMLGVMAKSCGLVQVNRLASFRRSLAGSWLAGLCMNVNTREVQIDDLEPQTIEDKVISAFEAPTYRLSIDPGNESRDLMQHDSIVYTDVWTYRKIRRVLGIEVAEEELATIGQLTPIEQEFSALSGGTLFQQYRQHSKTKGALVHTIYVKGSDSRFEHCFVEVEFKGRESVIWNMDDPSNPWGGGGLPFVRLGGHKPAEGWVDLSDFDLLKDDQDILNLALTQEQRLMRKTAGQQWDVDRKWFSDAADEEDIAEKFTNEAFGVRVGNPKRDAKPPVLQNTGSPPVFFQEVIARQEAALQDQSFRPGSYYGEIKSHVPADTVARTMEAAGDVYGQRVIEDIEQYAAIGRTLIGTTIGLVKSENLHTLQLLRRHGFGDTEFKAIFEQEKERPVGEVVVRESAARYRSAHAAEVTLNNALTAGAVSPNEWRAIMARDLDMPLGGNEKAARLFAQDTVQAILNGEQFAPMPMLPASGVIVLAELEQAMLDRSLPPEAQQALAQAFMAQQQMLMPPQPEQGQAAAPQPTAADVASPAELLGAALAGQV